MLEGRCYIDGAWREAEERSTFEVLDPATGALVGHAAAATAAQSREAVDKASDAFEDWSRLLPQERAALLLAWRDRVVANREALAQLIVSEQGKPISEARSEIDYAASFLGYYAEEATRPNIEGVTSHLRDAEVELWREPLGVAGLITPWNFPSAMLTRKAAAALAAGCTVVAHPSAETPFSALALATHAAEAGLPPGVFNVLTGDAATVTGPWLDDPRVRALSFTGSTEVGRLLYRRAGGTIKRLILELGGHAPVLVFEDADIERAAREAVAAKFATSGQDCLAANRIFVARPIYAAFADRFAQQVTALTVGPGAEDPDIGPLINAAAIRKQADHVADARAKGGRVLVGGERHPAGPQFFTPTVLNDTPDDALCLRQETFGPIAPLIPFDDESDVVRRANDTEYGLIAYLHTEDPRRIYRVSRALRFGMVAVNRTKVTGAPIPFGGMKQSGLGREGSRLGLEAFTDIKYVCRDWG